MYIYFFKKDEGEDNLHVIEFLEIAADPGHQRLKNEDTSVSFSCNSRPSVHKTTPEIPAADKPVKSSQTVTCSSTSYSSPTSSCHTEINSYGSKNKVKKRKRCDIPETSTEAAGFKDQLLAVVKNSLEKMNCENGDDHITKSCIELIRGTLCDMSKEKKINFLNKIVDICVDEVKDNNSQ